MLSSRLHMVAGCLLVVLSLDSAPARAQSQTEPESARPAVAPIVFDISLGTTPMDRSASLFSAGATAATETARRALQALLRDRVKPADKRAIAARLFTVALFEAPVIHFASGLNHEYGHMTRAREDGARLAFTLRGGPWSSEVFDLRCESSAERLGLGTFGGGFDAELLLERRLRERIDDEGRSGVSDALFLLNGAAGRFYYIQNALSKVTGRRLDDLTPWAGDPTRYVYELTDERGGRLNAAMVMDATRSARRRAWLNFADFGLAAHAWNALNFVFSGRDSFAPTWVRLGAFGVSPFSRYHLSPVGPQVEVGTRYQVRDMTGDMSVRWTEPVRGVRLVGTSMTWSKPLNAATPRVRMDVWRTGTARTGLRLEAGFTTARWPSRHASFQFALGAKTAGYVVGLPVQRTVYAQTGLRVRF